MGGTCPAKHAFSPAGLFVADLDDAQVIVVDDGATGGGTQDDHAGGEAITVIDDELPAAEGDLVGGGRLGVMVNAPRQVKAVAVHGDAAREGDIVGDAAPAVASGKLDIACSGAELWRGGTTLTREQAVAWNSGHRKEIAVVGTRISTVVVAITQGGRLIGIAKVPGPQGATGGDVPLISSVAVSEASGVCGRWRSFTSYRCSLCGCQSHNWS